MNKVIITLAVVVLIHMGYNFINNDLGDKNLGDKNLTKESILICYGDSLTAGYGAPIGRSYPDYLQSKLRLKVINKGINGDTTVSALQRFKIDVLDYNPGVVIVELGANDLIQGVELSETKTNLNYIVDELLKRNIRVYVVKFYSDQLIFNILKNGSKREFDNFFKELEEKEGVYLIEDIWKGIWGKHMYDSIHPDETGYKKMGEIYLEELRPILKKNRLIIGE
ncbi:MULTISPECIES: GDSL-type esterase/lipase family protein [Psychrilyobacter]|uniref:G-D-S-L family lipolytic protein n=1 Tax=Psychrilyobacter piezotolerans TaxID=2293438 RepID=A0ABX9KGU0_9FUSO|nr:MULTISPECIES: GDSL-type esterase/lipase family protein [Psychrilyobacter]MCS5420438.1 GDSL-type esterase/lipase family protein [Psychrilyobacter sp. S5]NDI78217.1 G-D-S-L family lipolytic protein [Psychrilyobacter piezotolerans]RDE61220.1 G-D-S-L family lipolytic protein [Psychrilyobacter sp. S5]REI40888.1 G-D-S-L family lipolytic protein [Psychrilyobacter piezotolerans]